MASNFRDLKVWKSAMDLVTMVYGVSKQFPKEEIYGLTSQMRRASVSIPSNIAEGHGRRTSGEFLQFLVQARGSLMELQTQVLIAVNLGYLKSEDEKVLDQKTEILGKTLNSLIASVKHQKDAVSG